MVNRCGEEYGPRASTEIPIAVFFPKDNEHDECENSWNTEENNN